MTPMGSILLYHSVLILCHSVLICNFVSKIKFLYKAKKKMIFSPFLMIIMVQKKILTFNILNGA